MMPPNSASLSQDDCSKHATRTTTPGEPISALYLDGAGKMTLQHRDRNGVGFLQVDAPVFQFIKRYARVAHGTANIGSRRDHAEVAVQILYLRFAVTRRPEFIQHG